MIPVILICYAQCFSTNRAQPITEVFRLPNKCIDHLTARSLNVSSKRGAQGRLSVYKLTEQIYYSIILDNQRQLCISKVTSTTDSHCISILKGSIVTHKRLKSSTKSCRRLDIATSKVIKCYSAYTNRRKHVALHGRDSIAESIDTLAKRKHACTRRKDAIKSIVSLLKEGPHARINSLHELFNSLRRAVCQCLRQAICSIECVHILLNSITTCTRCIRQHCTAKVAPKALLCSKLGSQTLLCCCNTATQHSNVILKFKNCMLKCSIYLTRNPLTLQLSKLLSRITQLTLKVPNCTLGIVNFLSDCTNRIRQLFRQLVKATQYATTERLLLCSSLCSNSLCTLTCIITLLNNTCNALTRTRLHSCEACLNALAKCLNLPCKQSSLRQIIHMSNNIRHLCQMFLHAFKELLRILHSIRQPARRYGATDCHTIILCSTICECLKVSLNSIKLRSEGSSKCSTCSIYCAHTIFYCFEVCSSLIIECIKLIKSSCDVGLIEDTCTLCILIKLTNKGIVESSEHRRNACSECISQIIYCQATKVNSSTTCPILYKGPGERITLLTKGLPLSSGSKRVSQLFVDFLQTLANNGRFSSSSLLLCNHKLLNMLHGLTKPYAEFIIASQLFLNLFTDQLIILNTGFKLCSRLLSIQCLKCLSIIIKLAKCL